MATYGRVKTWGSEVLEPSDLNTEFDNIVNNTNDMNSDNLDMTAAYAWTGGHTFGTTVGITGITTHGGNVVSDTDSTDDLGTSSVRWANLYVDSVGDTGQDLTVAATTVNLPSGHVFDYNAADVTLTHTANHLTIAGGELIATLDATAVLADGVTATTQSQSDGSTKVATTAYVDTASAGGVSLSGSTNNTIATVTGADALAGEANLTFDGSTLTMAGTAITMANIPSCLVMPVDSGLANVTGDGTVYTIVYGSEIFDQGADFSSTTFTAPATGRYQINGQVMLSNLGSGHTAAVINVVTSNRSYRMEFNPYAISSGTLAPMPFSMIADLDSADTVTVTVAVSGSTKTVYVNQNTSSDCRTWLSIQMIA